MPMFGYVEAHRDGHQRAADEGERACHMRGHFDRNAGSPQGLAGDQPIAAQARRHAADAGDRAEYAAALAAGFEAPPEIMAPFSSPEAFALPGGVPYLAREDGQVVAVGFGVFAEGTAGVFNIATVPASRGRGYGRAVTSRIVADGVARGADLAYLQSSEDGYPLYQSMGFRTVETWTYLLTAPGS